MRDDIFSEAALRFVFPIDGDCLNSGDGVVNGDGSLTVLSCVAAPEGAAVTVNGVPAALRDGKWYAPVRLDGRETVLNARAGQLCCSIKVLRLQGAEGAFCLSSDDNILFLADITRNADVYSSIFDNPYLAVYREAHERYGAKVHLNLFYEYGGRAKTLFSEHDDDFDLPMMTDRFRDEWRANSDWLKLAFHSRGEFPDSPYADAQPSLLAQDFELTRREVLRFAGEESFADTCTVHWGEATAEGIAELRRRGQRALTGYFEHDENGTPLVAYGYPDKLIDHVGDRDFWYDNELDMLYGRIDLVLNLRTHAENMALLREILSNPTRGGFVLMMIHEQYFYPDYKYHLADFASRVLDACACVSAAGRKSISIEEIVKSM